MRSEHLHQCLQEVTNEKEPKTANWKKVVALVQATFQKGTLAEACDWHKVVLINK